MKILRRLPPMNDYERGVASNVEKHGWHCTSVFPKEGQDTPCFSYSVGMYLSYGQPEFIVFGLDSKVAYAVLDTLAKAAASGAMYPLDLPCSDLLQDYDCMFVEVPRHRFNGYVFSALWFYAEVDFPLYQVVWPDMDGKFPWHEAYFNDPSHQQPVLASNE
jgi:hypothetical protein